MELFETINTRLTIRKYKSDTPPMDDIKKIIDAARLAPSATNSQNWQFIAVTNKKIMEEMKDAIIEKYDELSGLIPDPEFQEKMDYYKSYSTFFVNAPVLFVIVETPRKSYITEVLKENNIFGEKLKYMRPDSSLLSIGAAIENMSLAAHALGYGTCWMAAPVIATEAFSEILKLEKGCHVISIMPMGIPYRDDYKSPPKKTLEEVMRIVE